MLKKLLALIVMLYATLAMAAVDVNKATPAELDGIKGIGPVITKIIMSERKKGDFKDWPDFVERVKGVGDAKAAKLSEAGLTVNGTAFKPTAKKDAKATAKEDKKDAKATAKEEKKEAKATAKEEKKTAKAEEKAKEVKADAKQTKADAKSDAKAEAAKPAASAKK